METLDLSGTRSSVVQYQVLKAFWAEFGKDGNKHYCSSKNKITTLNRLKDIGDYIILRNNNPLKNRVNRDKFDRVKLYRHNLKSHKLCFTCRGRAEVRHHIIWIKNGGLNSKKNTISLCRKCHTFIHPWLIHQ